MKFVQHESSSCHKEAVLKTMSMSTNVSEHSQLRVPPVFSEDSIEYMNIRTPAIKDVVKRSRFQLFADGKS